MNKITAVLMTLREINGRYGIPVETLDRLEEEFREMKVCTPLIGKFSSGKSALLNALLGYSEPVLGEDIAPETAVPVELEYAENEDECPVTIFRNSGEAERCTLDAYRELTLDANKVRCVRIALRNRALEQIPDIQLVDMPGFESANDMHNRAIDGYVGRSMAYLLVFPADDMILRKTMADVLRELCRYQMPVEVVITKCDKVENEDVYTQNLAYLEESLKKYVGTRKIVWYRTSRNEGQLDSFRLMLAALQERSKELLAARQKELLGPEASNTIRYLQARLNGSALSESELVGKEDRLRKDMDAQARALRERSEGFRNRIPDCVAAICGEVQKALNNTERTFVSLVMNRHQINATLNGVVRQAIASGVQDHYLPLVDRYLQDVSAGELDTKVNANVVMGDFDVKKNSVVDPIVTGVGSTLMTGLPAAGLILGGLFALAGMLLHKRHQKEAEDQIRAMLNSEVFPEVLRQVEDSLRKEIGKHAEALEQELGKQREAQETVLNKSLADLRRQMQEEQAEKERSLAAVRGDLAQLEELWHGN